MATPAPCHSDGHKPIPGHIFGTEALRGRILAYYSQRCVIERQVTQERLGSVMRKLRRLNLISRFVSVQETWPEVCVDESMGIDLPLHVSQLGQVSPIT